MGRIARIALGIGGAVGAGWLGLRIPARPFAPYPTGNAPVGVAGLPASLPAPVDRYLRAIAPDGLPAVSSAVFSGRGSLSLGPVTFPARLRFVEAAGRGYRHYIECTWFGLPLLRVNEWYLDGHLRQELPVGVVADEPKADQAANLAYWAELAFWLPSATLADPRVRWASINATSARLVVPSGSGEDELVATFDAQTGLLCQVEALRYRSARDASKTPWRAEAGGWGTFRGMRLPSPVALIWLDQGTPWLVTTVEDAAYDVDVSSYLHARGR